MSNLSFKDWLSLEWGKDIFGFDSIPVSQPKPSLEDTPLNHLDIEQVLADMKVSVNAKRPIQRVESCSEIQWGDRPGAIKVSFGTLGALNVTFHQLVPDLVGHHRWVCKKVIPLGEKYNQKIERTMSEDLLNQVIELDKRGMETPNKAFEEMERLVVRLASEVRRKAPQIFVYEGVKKVDDSRYLIYFSVRGHGVQAKDQHRLEQYIIDTSFDNTCGVIRIFGNRIESSLGQHSWKLTPVDWKEVFMPSQQLAEIIEAVVQQMARY